MNRIVQGAWLLAALAIAVPALASPRPEHAVVAHAGIHPDLVGRGEAFPREVILHGTDAEGGTLTLRVPVNIFPQLQQPGSGVNVNLNQIGGATVSSSLYDSGNTALKVNCVVGCTASAGFTDNSAFTAGTTAVTNVGAVFNDALAAVTSGNAAAARITSSRALHVNLRNNSGTEIGTAAAPVRIDPTGTTTQPVSGTVTANIGTTNGLALDASVNGILNAQGSATSGEKGPLVQCAVSTAAPAYTTAQTDPLSCDTSGNLRASVNNTVTVSGTVTANQGGTWTVQPGSTQNTTPWLVQGNLSNNGAAAGANRVAMLPGVAQTSYNNGAAATQGRDAALNVGTDGLAWVAALPAMRPASYAASATVAPTASATDIAVLPGNASNTVLVTRVKISCTQTTAGIIVLQLIKRSTADTAGTSSAMTVVPDDSNYAAGASAPLTYTANPTLGTAVGNVDAYKLGCLATSSASPNDIYILNRTQKPIVLRGTAQQLALNLNAATVTGGSVAVTFEWIETATITP